MHPTVQEEVFGDDPDVLTASPYAPFGRAVPCRRRVPVLRALALLDRHRPRRLDHPRRDGGRRRRRARARPTYATSCFRGAD